MTCPPTRSRCRRASQTRANQPGFRTWSSPAMTPPRGAPNSAPKLAETWIGAIVTTAESAWAEAMRFENRANPFPFFDELRKAPVARVEDDLYVVPDIGNCGPCCTTHDSARTPVEVRWLP